MAIMHISTRGGALMGETGVHGMHTYKLNNYTCVRNYVVNIISDGVGLITDSIWGGGF
jgi:hypothetical protein